MLTTDNVTGRIHDLYHWNWTQILSENPENSEMLKRTILCWKFNQVF